MEAPLNRRETYLKRFNALKADRDASWLPHWRELAENICPRSFRTLQDDTNRGGEKKHGKIINSTPIDSARVLAAGMMAGITSPSRPWYRFTLRDAKQNKDPAAKAWLNDLETETREALAKSNVYKGLHGTYTHLGPFGTGVFWLDEDAEDGLRAYVLPPGSYVLANSSRMAIDTCYRELSLTVAQLVEMFGEAKCSHAVREQYRNKQLDERHEVLHVVEPNRNYVEGMLGPKGKKYLSAWMEVRATETVQGLDGLLRESGYEEFPVMAPRWETTGEDVYGSSPGMAALGDCKALQHLEKRAALAVDKAVNPPMQLPVQLQHGNASFLPGDKIYVDGLTPQQVARPAFEVNPQAISIFDLKIARHEERIKRAFYADLWLALTQSDGTMTAREVVERREEKLLQLGTVLENLQDELLDPLLERVIAVLMRQGRLPPAPPEIGGQEMKVEYTSIMAQAQKLIATTGLERIASFVGNLSQVDRTALDNLDTDKLVAAYADALGVPANTLRPAKVVEQVRKARAQAQQQQMAQEQAAEVANTAKTMADTSMEGPNALNEMLKGVGAR